MSGCDRKGIAMAADASEDFSHIRDSFCVFPFLQLAISPSGVAKPCGAFKRLIEKDGRAMSVYEYPVEDIWNSDAMRSIRRNMVDGKPVNGCANCYKQAEQKLRSVGEAANDAYKSGWLNPRNETIADLKQRAVNSNFTLPSGPERLDINVGNLCNLSCRMCNSGSSSSIAADPVQQKWSHASSAFPARWKSLETAIAPHRALGVSYEGLSEIDWSNDEPVAWTNGQAQFTVSTDGVGLAGITVAIAEDRPFGQQLRLFVNSHAIYDGVPAPGPWSKNFSFENIHPVDSKLHISIEFYRGNAQWSRDRNRRRHSAFGPVKGHEGPEFDQHQPLSFREAMVPGQGVHGVRPVLRPPVGNNAYFDGW